MKKILCKCGCGTSISSIDKKGRNVFYVRGHFGRGKKLSSEHRHKLSESKKWLYKDKGNIIGFKKGNKLSDHPKAVATRFRAGENIREKSPNWNGGSSYLPYSLDWTKTLRISIRERDKYTCKICGNKQGDRAFDVHHIDYNKKNCSPDNLVTLCHNCHTRTNHNRDFWLNYFNNLLYGEQK